MRKLCSRAPIGAAACERHVRRIVVDRFRHLRVLPREESLAQVRAQAFCAGPQRVLDALFPGNRYVHSRVQMYWPDVKLGSRLRQGGGGGGGGGGVGSSGGSEKEKEEL